MTWIFSIKNEPTTSSTSTTRKTTSTRTTIRWTTTTEQLVTAPNADPHKNTASILGAVFGVLLVLIILGVSIYTVRKRNIKVPGLETVRGLMNPGYQKMDKDIGMVIIDLRDYTCLKPFIL